MFKKAISWLMGLVGNVGKGFAGLDGTLITALLALAFMMSALMSGYFWGKHGAELVCLKTQQTAVANAIDQANQLADENAQILFAASEAHAKSTIRQNKRAEEAVHHVATHPDLYGQHLDACGVCLKSSAAHDTDPSVCPCQSATGLPAAAR